MEDATLDTEEEELFAVEIREAPVVGIKGFQKAHQFRGGSHRPKNRKDKAVRDARERGRIVQQYQEGHQTELGIFFRYSLEVSYPRCGVQGGHVVEALSTFNKTLLRVVRVPRNGVYHLPVDRCSHPFVNRIFTRERPGVFRLSPLHQLGVVISVAFGGEKT